MARLVIFGQPGDPRKWILYANQITARIVDGRYPHGQWLPPLAKISADLGVESSYNLLRRALKEMCIYKLISFAEPGYYVGDSEPKEMPKGELRHYAARTIRAGTSDNSRGSLILAPGEVAAIFGVDPKTVTKWANAQKLGSFRTLGGQRRYYASEVEHLRDRRRKEQND